MSGKLNVQLMMEYPVYHQSIQAVAPPTIFSNGYVRPILTDYSPASCSL
jgi:hypothetical protein